MVDQYNKESQEVLKQFNSNIDGLSTEKVKEYQKKYGYNELNESDGPGILKIFLSQFADFLVIILLCAAAISMFMKDFESSAVIIAVTILNAVLGTVQYVKAQKSLASLKAMTRPSAKVIRDGEKQEIPSREVVPGDILIVEAGDSICADCRIVENCSLQVNESSLTGESEPVIKHSEVITEVNVPIGDRKNMVFSGSLVTYGRATCVVTGTGMKTELGKIATLLETAQEKKTPLQVNLDKFGKKLSIAILILCAGIFILNAVRGYEIMEALMFAIALAVAAIPEALSSIVTIVLAIGTQKMAKENAIVRKLHSVESLGSVSIICSDKTGTLTQNKMKVKKIFVNKQLVDSQAIDKSAKLQNKLVTYGILCSDAQISTNNDEIGDPTEIALVKLARDYNENEVDIRNQYPRLAEIPFDSDRKLMSTVHKVNDELVMVTKGALDIILGRITTILENDSEVKLASEHIDAIRAANKELSENGLRVLAVACKKLNSYENIRVEDEAELTFLGMFAMIDPPREESKQAVEDCKRAGIKPVMITGDHIITASAIAKQIGILDNRGKAIEGKEIENMSDEQLVEEVANISVYARVSPEHKIRIVRAWQQRGNVVAMTGDGVNDAPALKQADIGVAMGKTGTEVAKDASSMVLTDDNFATIVKAVSYGRSIYTNIKSSIKFLLSGNMAGILAVLFTSIANLPLPFTAVHLLFINLITDSMPAIALGLEPYGKNIMNEKPRAANESILTGKFLAQIVFEGFVISACTITAFYYGLNIGGATLASTMAFTVMTLSRLLHGFNCRSGLPLFKIGLFTNKFQWLALLGGVLLLTGVLAISPLQSIFDVDPTALNHIGMVVLFSLVPLVTIQIYKTIAMLVTKRK